MAEISAGSIKDFDKKNEIILFAQKHGCKAIYDDTNKEMVISCPNSKLEKLMEKEIKQLSE